MAVQLDKSRAAATRQQSTALEGRSPLLDGGTFESMWRLAEALSYAKTMPAHLRDNPGDCLRVVEYAHRCGYSPFALADCTFLVGGKMGFEGKAVAAMVNASPLIDGALDYAYEGAGEARKVTVSGRRRGEAQVRTVEWTVRQGIADSKGARERWTKDPDQMLAYAGARIWARRHCPESILGIYSPEELLAGVDAEHMVDITPRHDAPPAEHHEIHDQETGEVEQPAEAKPARTIPLYDESGTVAGNYTSGAEWLTGLENLARTMPGLIIANWDMLTRIVTNAKTPDDVRERAQRLRDEAPAEGEAA